MQKFDFTIYPRKLWVGSIEDLPSFTSRKNKELESPEDDFSACTYCVTEKESLLHGFFVAIKEDSNIQDYAHEAVHVALTLCEDLDIEVDTVNQEILAYLIGYITNCISSYANQANNH